MTIQPEKISKNLFRLVPYSLWNCWRAKTAFASSAFLSISATGAFIISTEDGRKIFVTGHLEYDTDTLQQEYVRDFNKGMNPLIPENYYPNGDTQSEPVNTWRSNANLFYGNWLNYQVYQNTPYDINKIGEKMSLRSDSYEADED